MLKKILLIVGNIFLGLNLGVISCFMPVYLILAIVLFPENPINMTNLTVFSVINGIIASVGIYIYSYRKKREHEDPALYATTFWVSFAVGAFLMAVLLFVFTGSEGTGVVTQWG